MFTGDVIIPGWAQEEESDMPEDTAQMPQYRSHKRVWALKIAEITPVDDKSVIITPVDEGFAPFEAATENRPKPEVGMYFVRYADGYTSFSPSEAFETGYTRTP